MRLLLDTQLALWAVLDDPRLGGKATELILDLENQLFVSAASLWEIAIKHQLPQRRDPIPITAKHARALFESADYHILPITAAHAEAVDDLPPHHSDPFDRIVAAQAIAEPMRLLTRDRRLRDYGDLVEVV